MTKITASVEEILTALDNELNLGPSGSLKDRIRKALATLPQQDEREVLMKFIQWWVPEDNDLGIATMVRTIDRYLSESQSKNPTT